jgi:uncharacterized protein with HEPN domain
MRNRLIHNYDDVNPEVIWITIKGDLPDLRKHIEALLANVENKK